MWQTVMETYLPLLVGAGITLVTALILNNRTHKQELDDRQRERAIAAREIRLKEGEEIAKTITAEFFHLADVVKQMLNAESKNDLKSVHESLERLTETIMETNKGNNIYIVSIRSLGDDKLTKALEKINYAFTTYLNFSIDLAGLLEKNGIDLFLKDHDKHMEDDKVLREQYYHSAEGFLRRINEVRSQ